MRVSDHCNLDSIERAHIEALELFRALHLEQRLKINSQCKTLIQLSLLDELIEELQKRID